MPDIEAKEISGNAYSIEDAKVRAGEDSKRAAAEELKDKVRQSIKLLQRDYREAVKLNLGIYIYIYIYMYIYIIHMYIYVYIYRSLDCILRHHF
jgi:hypothetical protein